MTEELLYTSAPGGLKPGSAGFCVVMASKQLSNVVADQLERLSGYRHLAMPGTPEASLNPVGWSHIRLTVGSKSYAVLARIADAGLDYTNRSNMIAHYLLLDDNLPAGGPAHAIGQPGVMETSWDGPPRRIDSGRPLPSGNRAPAPCRAWAQATGDAGWAGVLAKTVLDSKKPTVYLVYQPGTNVLALFDEAIALLPPQRRWQATFNTFTQKLANNVECQWRAVVAGSPEDAQSQRQQGAMRIDLTRPMPPASGPEAEAARAGQQLAVAAKPVAAPPPPVDAPPKGVARPLSLDAATNASANATTEQAAGHEPQPAEIDTYSLAQQSAAQQSAPSRNPPPPGQAAIDWRGEDVSGSGTSKLIGLAVGLVVAVGVGIGAWAALSGGEEIVDDEPGRSSRSSKPVVASHSDNQTEPSESNPNSAPPPNSVVASTTETQTPSTTEKTDSPAIKPDAAMASTDRNDEPEKPTPKPKPGPRVPTFAVSEQFIASPEDGQAVRFSTDTDDDVAVRMAYPAAMLTAESNTSNVFVEYDRKDAVSILRSDAGQELLSVALTKQGADLSGTKWNNSGVQDDGVWSGLVVTSPSRGLTTVRMIETVEIDELSATSASEGGDVNFAIDTPPMLKDSKSIRLPRLNVLMTTVECRINGNRSLIEFATDDHSPVLASVDSKNGRSDGARSLYSPELTKAWEEIVLRIDPDLKLPASRHASLGIEVKPAEVDPNENTLLIRLQRRPVSAAKREAVKNRIALLLQDLSSIDENYGDITFTGEKKRIDAAIKKFDDTDDRSELVATIEKQAGTAIRRARKHLQELNPKAAASLPQLTEIESDFNQLSADAKLFDKDLTAAEEFIASLGSIAILKTRIYYEAKLSQPLKTKRSGDSNFTDITTEFDLVRIGDWEAERRDLAHDLIDQLHGHENESTNAKIAQPEGPGIESEEQQETRSGDNQ